MRFRTNRVLALALLALCTLGAQSAWAQTTLTQSTDPNTITNNNSVSCNAGGYHADNSYYRAYTIAANASIASVRFGVEEDSGGPNPLQIKIYSTSVLSGTPTLASLTQLGTTVNVLTPGNSTWNLTTRTLALNQPINVTAGQRIVVEIFTASNQAVGGSFFIGSNAGGQTGPGYLLAPLCGLTVITDMTASFPSMHMIIDLVTFTTGGAPNPEIDVQRPNQGPAGSIASGATNVSVGTFTPGGGGNITFTVANTGASTALTTAVGISVPLNCTPGSPTLAASIAAGTTATLTIPITVAAGAGSFSFLVTITNNDANEGTYTLACVGGRGLSGTVTVKTSGGTYTDLGQAFNDMEDFGVAGNLIIELDAGNYTPTATWELGSDFGGGGSGDDVMVASAATTVTIRAATGAVVNINGGATQTTFDGIQGLESGCMSIVGVSNVSVERLNFTGGAGTIGFGLLIGSDFISGRRANTAAVRQCSFASILNGAGLWFIGNGFKYDNLTVENCSIRNCGGGNTIYGTNFMPGSLGFFYPGVNVVVQHCSITNNAGLVAAGQQGNPGAVGWRGPVAFATPPTLNFNVFTSSTSAFPIYHFTGAVASPAAPAEFPTVADRNVYFLSGGAVFAVESGATPTVRTDFTAWRTQYGTLDVNSLNSDPLFVSALNLHLNAGSPALELATTSTLNLDIDGDTRPSGAQRDSGSDERTGAATPLLTVSTNNVTVPTSTAGTAGTAASFTVSGSNLTPASGNVTLTLTTGAPDIEFRNATAAGAFATTVVTVAYTGGAFANQTIEVRFAAAATAGAKTGSITIAGGGATNQVVNLTGTVNASGTPTLSVSSNNVTVPTTTAGTAGTAASFTVSGSNLTPASGNVTLTLTTGAPDIQFRNATAAGTFATTPVTIAYTGGAFAAQTIEVRFAAAATAGAKTGSITISGGGATNQVVNLTGTVNVAGGPTLSVSTNAVTVPTTVAGTAGTAGSFTVSGSNLTPASGNVTLTLTTGAPDIQFRNATAAGTFATTPVTIAYTGGAFAAQTIEVRFAAAATAGAKTGSITISGGGATNQVVNLSGTVTSAAGLTIVTTTLPTATVGTAFNGTITAQNGTGPYTWSLSAGTLPAGLTLNTAATGLTTSITGTPTAAGAYSFTIQIADSAAGTDTQVFSGTVNPAGTGGTIGTGGGGGGGCSTDADFAPWFMLAALGAIVFVASRRRRTA